MLFSRFYSTVLNYQVSVPWIWIFFGFYSRTMWRLIYFLTDSNPLSFLVICGVIIVESVCLLCFRATGLFVFLYSIYYFWSKSSMSGMLQTVEYFTYTILLCYIFFLTLGTVSFFASFKFIKYIYRNLKMDWSYKPSWIEVVKLRSVCWSCCVVCVRSTQLNMQFMSIVEHQSHIHFCI